MNITVHQRGIKDSECIRPEDVSLGSKVQFKKISGLLSDYLIEARIGGEVLGYASEVTAMLMPGSQIVNEELYEQLPESFEGVIENKEQKTGKSTQTIFAVKINVSVSGGATTSSEGKTFRLKIKGNAVTCPGKMTVLDEYEKDSSKVFVELFLDKDESGVKIISTKLSDGTIAGKVDMKEISGCSTLEEIAILQSVLDSGESIESKVDDVKGNSYFVTLNVSAETIEAKEMEMTKSLISNIKDDLIKDGFEESTLTGIEEYLLNNGFNADYVMDIFKTYKKYPDDVQPLIPTEPRKRFEDSDLQLLLTGYASMCNGLNILCSGEKGTGKNVYIDTMAWIYQRPLYAISINRETDKLDLVGSRVIKASLIEGEAVTEISFEPEVLIRAMQVGAIINIDEINFADPGITGLLHSIADDRRSVQVPGYGFVEADDNFCIMATMNVDYQGTCDLNEAMADRFVDLVFPNTDSIYAVLEENCPDVKKEIIKSADKIYTTILTQIRDMDASIDSSCLTIRGFIQAVKMSKIIGLKKALVTAVANKVRDEDYRKNVISIIDTYIS